MRLVKLVKLQKMCMDSEDGKTDMNTSDKAKRATPFLNALCDMYAICFKKKKSFFTAGMSPNLTPLHAVHLAILKCSEF